MLEQTAYRALKLERWTDATGALVKLAPCDPKKSEYNMQTGKCDPVGPGGSLRWQLELASSPDCHSGAPDTEHEVIVATFRIPRNGSVTV